MTLNKPVCPGLFYIAFLFFFAGCSTPEYSPVYYANKTEERPRSALAVTKDTILLARIKARLFSDDLVDQQQIRITVRHGVVILEGQAQDIYHRRMILNLLESTDGVVRIEDRLGLEHSGTTALSSQDLVKSRIQLELLSDRELGRQPVSVAVTHNEIILSGTVASMAQKQKAGAIAIHHAGTRRVVNQLNLSR